MVRAVHNFFAEGALLIFQRHCPSLIPKVESASHFFQLRTTFTFIYGRRSLTFYKKCSLARRISWILPLILFEGTKQGAFVKNGGI